MCLRPDPTTRPDFEELCSDVNRRLGEIAQASRQLSGTNYYAPQLDERLYYRGNEINSMQTGDWTPTHAYVLDELEESGFKDPFITNVKFPRWNRAPITGAEEEDSDLGDPDEDVKRVMAPSFLAAQATGATGKDDVSMGIDRTNNNDDGEGEGEGEGGGEGEGEDGGEEGPTAVTMTEVSAPGALAAPLRQRWNKFGRARMGW